MRSRTKALITLVIALLVAGGIYCYCNVFPSVQADNEYQEGIRLYESGNYEESIRRLSATLRRPPTLLPVEKRARAVEVLGLVGAKLWETRRSEILMVGPDRYVHGPPESSQVVSILATQLSDREATVRKAAVRALAMTGVLTAAQPLAGSLKDRDVSVRREAVFALATIYNAVNLSYSNSYPAGLRPQVDAADVAAHRALAAALKDSDPEVRERAAIAFGRIGDKQENRDRPRADPFLREALTDENIAVRIYAYQALHRLLGGVRVEAQRRTLQADAIELLSKALEHEDWTVRYKAADVLLRIHDASVVEPLHKSLQDEYQPVRLAAARALGEIQDATSIEPLAAALGDEDAAVRYRAAEALAALGQPAIEALQEGSRTANLRGRMTAAIALGMTQRDLAAQAFDGQADRQLLADALRTEDDAGRQSAAELAGMLADKSLVEPLVAALADEHSNVRYRAAEALGRIGDPTAVAALTKALSDAHQAVRVKAAEALGELKDPRAVEPLIELMKGEDHSVGHFAREALSKIGEPAVPALIANLGYQGPPWAGAHGAVLSGDLVGVPGVMGYPCANEFPIPLGKIGALAVEPLVVALKNDDPIAQNAALLALAIVWATSPYSEPSFEDRRIEIFSSEYSVVRGNPFRAFSRGDAWVPSEPFKPLPAILGIRVRDFGGVFPGEPKPPRPFPKIPDDTTAAAVDAVIEVLQEASRGEDRYGRKRDVQYAAVLALRNIRSPLAVERLLELVTEPTPSRSITRRLAAGALGEIKDRQSVPRLIEALKDRTVVSSSSKDKRESRVRDFAAGTLGQIGDPSAIEPLEEALKDEEEDEEFRQRVTEALAKIKGEQ